MIADVYTTWVVLDVGSRADQAMELVIVLYGFGLPFFS